MGISTGTKSWIRQLAGVAMALAIAVPAMIATGAPAHAADSMSIDKSLRDVADHGDGTLTATYDVVVSADSASDQEYELVDELRFGDGVAVLSTTLTGQDGLDVNEAWDGVGVVSVTNGAQTLPAGTTANYRIAVTVTLDDVLSDGASDCELADGEDGTGLWNTATVTNALGEVSDAECVEIERPALSIDKSVIDGPTRDGDGFVTITYGLSVTNTGAAATVYDLTDKFAFAADATVQEVVAVNVEPGNVHVNAGFDGTNDTAVATASLAPGETHRYSVSVLITDSQTPLQVTPASGPGGESNPLGDLMKSLGEGAAGQVGGAIAGQAMAALGLGGDGGLAELQVMMGDIVTALGAIETQLDAIDQTLLKTNCNDESTAANKAAGDIATDYDKYSDFVDNANGINTVDNVPALPDPTKLAEWVDTILGSGDPEKSMLQKLQDIHTGLMGEGAEQGIIEACLDPGLAKPPTAGETDTVYYDHVAGLMTTYYYSQMLGLMMYAEALHLEALWSITVPVPLNPLTFNPCAKDWNPTQLSLCGDAANEIDRVWERLATQYAKAGAPYTWGEVIVVYKPATEGPPVLFVKSLEKFTNDPGCPTPLTQASPCGLTVGRQTTASITNTFGKTYHYTNTWRPADAVDFETATYGRPGNQVVGTYLDSLGFETAGGKVVVFADTFSWSASFWGIDNVKTTKFLDTRFPWQVIGESDPGMDDVVRNGPLCSSVLKYWAKPIENSVITDQSNRWYNIDLDPCNVDGSLQWKSNPGYKTDESQWSFAKAYRWPATDPNALPCSKGRSNTNMLGMGVVQTMCGSDFNAWFEAQAPRPATCDGNTFGVCTGISPETPDPTAYDCELQSGEDGTGLLDRATATYSQGTLSTETCAPTPPWAPADCTDTVDGFVSGQLIVRKGMTCLVPGANVRDEVIVRNGASVWINRAVLRGGFRGNDVGAVTVSNSTVRDGLAVTRSTGQVDISGNDVWGHIEIRQNLSGVAPVVSDNDLRGRLKCWSNDVAPTDNGFANRARLSPEGQCAPLG